MILRRYSSIAEFFRENKEYLMEEEVLNNIILGNCMAMTERWNIKNEKFYFSSVFDNSRIIASAFLIPPFPLLIYGQGVELKNSINFIAESLLTDGIRPQKVLALENYSSEFSIFWKVISGATFSFEQDIRLYECKDVKNKSSVKGILKTAEKFDINQISQWIIDMEKEEGYTLSDNEARKIVQQRILKRDLYLLEDSVPVSMAVKLRETKNSALLSSVYTPPELRRQGYAFSLVAQLTQYLLDSGYTSCALFTKAKDVKTCNIYTKVGYKAAGEFKEYFFNY